MEFVIVAILVVSVLLVREIYHKDIKKEGFKNSSMNHWNDLVMNEKSKIICLDSETTGLDPKRDEILQLSIIDGNGNVLFSKYIKPTHRRSWREAEAIHGISPEMVKDKLKIVSYKDEINRIIEDCSVIVGYNHFGFDLKFLKEAGIIPYSKLVVDVMENFSSIYGDWNPKYKNYTFKKLKVCADYYKYPRYKSHDSLEDAKATLHCFYQMEMRKQIKFSHLV